MASDRKQIELNVALLEEIEGLQTDLETPSRVETVRRAVEYTRALIELTKHGQTFTARMVRGVLVLTPNT